MIQIIDILLLKNTYFKKLSVADRLAIYNITLKQVAELRNYFYTNQTSTPNFTINIPSTLSSMDNIDDILLDDLQLLSQQERLLIYNIVQSRIGSLRNLQNHHYYLVSNIRGLLKKIRVFSLPIISVIKKIIYTIIPLPDDGNITVIIKEKFLVLPILESIITLTQIIQQKTLTFPIALSIIAGLQHIKKYQLPISTLVQTISITTTKIKSLILPLQGIINLIASGTTKIKLLTFPIANTIITIFASVTIQQKSLLLPLTKSIVVLASYQHLKEKQLTMPLTNSINTI